jgi:DNA gyrase inhibitor GyrI
MVLLFTEMEALRERIKSKESEINSVRKSFIQMTVAGDLSPNKMSRILGIAKQNFES